MITSSRIKLRAIENQDSSFYYNWINDNETNKWRGLYHPMASDDVESAISSLKKADPTKLSLMILNENNAPIGIIGLRGICARSRRAEIWVYIGEKGFWNNGYGQESLSTLVKYSFEEMNLHRIWLECDPEFSPAVKCYENVGFQKEGILKDGYYRRGKFRDTMMMGLIRKYEEFE